MHKRKAAIANWPTVFLKKLESLTAAFGEN